MDEFNVSVTESPLAIGGEYETFVCDGSTFKRRIQFLSRRIWDSKTGSGFLNIDEAELLQKKGTT